MTFEAFKNATTHLKVSLVHVSVILRFIKMLFSYVYIYKRQRKCTVLRGILTKSCIKEITDRKNLQKLSGSLLKYPVHVTN